MRGPREQDTPLSRERRVRIDSGAEAERHTTGRERVHHKSTNGGRHPMEAEQGCTHHTSRTSGPRTIGYTAQNCKAGNRDTEGVPPPKNRKNKQM